MSDKTFYHLISLVAFAFLTLLSIDSTKAQGVDLSKLKPQFVRPFSELLEWRKVEAFEYPTLAIQGDVVFSIHSTKYWDQKSIIGPSIKLIQEYAARKNIPFIYLASQEEMKTMASEQKQKSLLFEGDSHFYRTTGTITFAGGNFTQCLCNAIRSSIIHNPDQVQSINIVTDAIYEIPFPSILDVNLKKKLRPSGQDRNLLSEILEVMNEEQIISYLSSEWISADTLPCPLYKPAFLVLPNKGAFQYRILYRGNWIGRIGMPNGSLITLNFIEAVDLR